MSKIKQSISKMPMIASIILLLLILLCFSACLKNGDYNTNFSTAGASVDLPLAAANNNSVVTFSYDAGLPAGIPIYINLASPNTLGTVVTAIFALDTAYLNNYNTLNATDFQLLPDSDYTVINGWTRSIPAGQRLDSMYVTFNVSKMDLSVSYVLPITIQSASVPIEQWNHLLINPQVKNKYDGQYDLVIKTVGWGAFGIADGPPALDYGSLGMVTNSTSTVVFSTGAQPVFSGGVPA